MAAVVSYSYPSSLYHNSTLVDFSSNLSARTVFNYSTATKLGKATTNWAKATVTSNLPISLAHTTITCAATKSFIKDYYYRIYITPKELLLGFVTSEQTRIVEIYNAFFSNITLNNITAVNGDGILLESIAVNDVINPLAADLFTVRITSAANLKIDADFTFTYDLGSVNLSITGVKTIPFFYPPKVEFTEKRDWLTDVINTKKNEQRFALRNSARLTVDYNYVFLKEEDFRSAMMQGWNFVQYAVAVPHWSNVVPLSNLTSGMTTITIDTTSLELLINQSVVFYETPTDFEMAEIQSFTDNSITLKHALGSNRDLCYFIPMLQGYLNNGVDYKQGTPWRREASLSLTTDASYVEAVWFDEIRFNSLPIVNNPKIASDTINSRIIRDMETVDCQTGKIIKFPNDALNRLQSNFTFIAETRAELYKMKRALDFLKGKYQSFWVPSSLNDITVLTTINVGTSSIDVVFDNWSLYPVKAVKITGSTVGYFEIDTIIDNYNGTETFTFKTASTVQILNISKCELLTKMRMTSDTETINYLSRDVASVTITAVEVY
jgi:hypothetical protein